jgi:AcrR family transcriptional regulator
VVSSAVYRYVKSRDDLLTLLVVDGYNDLADAVEAAVSEVAADQHRDRFLAFGRAIRGWALAEPATYSLLYGAPVPGYDAPAELTTGPGTRVVQVLLDLAVAASAAGALAGPSDGLAMTPGLAAGMEGVRDQFGVTLPDDVLLRGVRVWASLFGCVSFEVFGQYGPDRLGDPEALFEHHLAALATELGVA